MKQKWITPLLVLALVISVCFGLSANAQKKRVQEQLHETQMELYNIGYAATRFLVTQEDVYWYINKLLPDGEDPAAMAELAGYLTGTASMDMRLVVDAAVEGLTEEEQEVIEPLVSRCYEHNWFLADNITACPPENRAQVREQCQALMALLRDEVMVCVFGGEPDNASSAVSKLGKEMDALEKLIQE